MTRLIRWKFRLASYLMSLGRDSFIISLPPRAAVFDVGCGNNSPDRVKTLRPDVHYVGLDISDYNQSPTSFNSADEYVIVRPDHFPRAIESRKGQFDAVISSHNLEHCEEPWAVLEAMLSALKNGGRIYLSFPSEQSVAFPSRSGTLNFTDDPTHRFLPPFDKITDYILSRGFSIRASSRRYRPSILFFLGLLLEPFSMLTKRNMPFGATWALYGFESVIWASKKSTAA